MMTTNVSTRRHWPICWLLVFVAITGCDRPPQSGGASLFPTSAEAAEWTRTSDIRTFAAADLWKYIDGEAERYLAAGVQTASTADYRLHDKYDAVVDIYRMATAGGAEQIFAAEPLNGGEVVQLGDTARLYGQSLIFCEGPYLVRVTAYQEAPEIKAALLVLGRAIEPKIRN